MKTRTAFTLVELLVVLAIIAILVSVLLPAIHATRESVRRSQCTARLGSILQAIAQYQYAHGVYPAGVTNPTGPTINEPEGFHQSWIIHILPQMDESLVYRMIDLEKSVYDPVNQPARDFHIRALTCPSAVSRLPSSSYAGVHNDTETLIDATNNGTFVLNTQFTPDDIRDGTQYTLFVGEKTSTMTSTTVGCPEPDPRCAIRGRRSTERAPPDRLGSPNNKSRRICGSTTTRKRRATKANPLRRRMKRTRMTPCCNPLWTAPSSAVSEARMRAVRIWGSETAGSFFFADDVSLEILQKLANRADGELVDTRELD